MRAKAPAALSKNRFVSIASPRNGMNILEVIIPQLALQKEACHDSLDLNHFAWVRRALHKKSRAVIDRPYSLGFVTVEALYERPRFLFCAKPVRRFSELF